MTRVEAKYKPGHNRKLTDEFLDDLQEDIKANPSKSMHTMAKAKAVDKMEYIKVLKNVVKQWLDANYSGGN